MPVKQVEVQLSHSWGKEYDPTDPWTAKYTVEGNYHVQSTRVSLMRLMWLVRESLDGLGWAPYFVYGRASERIREARARLQGSGSPDDARMLAEEGHSTVELLRDGGYSYGEIALLLDTPLVTVLKWKNGSPEDV